MRIKITGKGIYGGDGEVAPGTELTIKGEPPIGWAGKYEIVTGNPKPDATPILNEDAGDDDAAVDVADDKPRRGRPRKEA